MKRPFIFLCVLLVLFGLRWWFWVDELGDEGAVVELRGMVNSDVLLYRSTYRYTLNHSQVKGYGATKNLSVGDLLRVKGRVNEEDGSWGHPEKSVWVSDFSIEQEFEDLSMIDQMAFSIKHFIFQYIYMVRDYCKERFERYFSGRRLGLLAGMVLGDQTGIDREFYEQLRQSGLLHVVVASGGNIALVSMVLFRFMKTFPRGLRYGLSYVFIWGYAVLTGMEPPIVRACVMVGLIWGGKLLGRKTSSMWVLIVCALVMLIIDPLFLWSVSFLLSFSATCGIVMFAEKIEMALQWLFKPRPLKTVFQPLIEVISQTISAQILVVPLILSVFSTINPILLVTNVLIGVLIFPVTVSGLVFVLIPDVLSIIQILISWLLLPLLDYFIFVVKYFGSGDTGMSVLGLGPWIIVGWWAIVLWVRFRRW